LAQVSAACADNRPDILFIAIDDLNDWVDFLPDGHPDSNTPRLTELARSGVSFTNAHTPSSVCNPARIATLTGLHPRRTGIYGNKQEPMRHYLPDAVTLFEHFDDHGYHVAGTGKLFHNPDNKGQRWDEYYDAPGRPKPDQLPANGLTGLYEEVAKSFDWAPMDQPESEWAEYRMADFAIEQLLAEREEPRFIAVGFKLPHLSWFMPKAVWDRTTESPAYPPYLPGDRDDMPPEARTRSSREHEFITAGGKWQEAIRAYLASSIFVDDQVGRVLDALQHSPRRDNTVIVVWSDHGWHLGEKDAWRKYSFWEESTRVPFLFAGPGIAANAEVHDPVTLLDIYPTLVTLAGLPPVEGLDGVDLSAVLAEPRENRLKREYVITSLSGGDTVRSRHWRYTRYNGGDEELYDHRRDPNEWNNLAARADYADVLNRFRPVLDPAGRAPTREPLAPGD
jgi:arylsulfatase A-like enzyme